MTKQTLEQLYSEHKGKVSDKWSSYLVEYERILGEYRDKPVRLLEIGVQNGGSLEIWSKFLVNAQKLVGCDINPDCAQLEFEDPRIAVIVGDANLDTVQYKVLQQSPVFDVIIDDGSHISSDIVKSFAKYFPHLEDSGLFIAEDLHCSYWASFEGGLFDQFSSITFFKLLADIVNHEHWGIDKAQSDILRGFFAKYGCDIDEKTLSQVHSVEFINSMCLVRKAPATDNNLGRRVVAGITEPVVSGHHLLNGVSYRCNQKIDESNNSWITRTRSPGESIQHPELEVANLNQTVLEQEGQISSLNQTVLEQEGQISSLNQTVLEQEGQISSLNKLLAERDIVISAIISSTSWRVTKPLRLIKKMLITKKYTLNLLRFIYHHSIFTPRQTNWVKDFCYRNFPSFFIGERSYEIWLERMSTNYWQLTRDINFDLMLPAKHADLEQENYAYQVVDVIVPVYLGLDQTKRCINSVLNSNISSPYRLIVINDASPDIEVTEYLRSLSSSQQVIIVENTDNLGFTATVNRGMTWSDKNDVLLLNSDTEVANDWLDKLKAQAYSGSRVGSVTPFSNHATICNYPTLDGMKELPDSECVVSLDAAFASANKGRNIEIPTAIGFCMYIRRDCLDEVGLFDVETFGKGYGEENDFCLRATAKGWKHLLAADTFVFHEGEVSFQAGSNPRKERAMNILRGRYPRYEADVARHVAKNEAYPLRVAATAARFRRSELPVILHILHAHGGGTQKHVKELCLLHHGKAKLLIMTPPFPESGKTTLQISSADPLDALDIHLPSSNLDFLVSLIQSFGVSLVHIHHVLGYSFDLHNLINKLKVPFYLTVHDYMLMCPRINMMPIEQNYCGDPEPSKCNQCLSVDYPRGEGDIIWWRESHAWLFNDASLVICPSHDVAHRCQRYFPHATYRVVAHEKCLDNISLEINVPKLNENEPLRVAILGVLARHKGIELIIEALLVAERINAPLQFQLIGYAETNLPSVSSTLFSQTGHYIEAELITKINTFNPHLILFPACWPETYSYTLSAALISNYPIMASNIGAFPERLVLRPWSWLIDWNISAAQLVEKLCAVRNENFYGHKPPILFQKSEVGGLAVLNDSEFYEYEYLSVGNNIMPKGGFDIRVPGKIVALVLVENVGLHPSPCAYIRLILPLIRERGDKLDLRWVTIDDVTHYVADVLICQRTEITSISAIESIVTHCRENNIRIVYDLDDMLLALPEDHPEKEIYEPTSAAVLHWVIEADQVWVSTEALQEKICQINSRTYVVPNYLDEKLWLKPKMSEVNHDLKAPVRLLYMGTQTHGSDFELVKGVLKKLKSEFVEGIEINLIGIATDIGNEKWYNTITPPHGIGSGYPAFVNWICNQPNFDIGIAPLIDNEFNRCKSAIKFQDYSVLGLATVASDINGYALIRNGENGFRVKNTEEAWYEALKTLIDDSNLRSQIQLTAQKEIFEKYGYESVARHRVKLLTSLLSALDGRISHVEYATQIVETNANR